MKIECPACEAVNDVCKDQAITCGECSESLTGHSYRKSKKRLISATLAFAVGVGGAHFVDHHILEKARYPLGVEYSIVDACLNGDSMPLDQSLYKNKRKICICAVEETTQDIPYADLDDRMTDFKKLLYDNMSECLG